MKKSNAGITPELREFVTQEVAKLDKSIVTKNDYENILKECKFDYFLVSNVYTAGCVVGLINGLTGHDFTLSQMDMVKYIDFNEAVKNLITKDEFYKILGRMRNFASSTGISFREIVILEMLWLTTKLKDIVFVLDKDVQCVSLPDHKAVYYTYNNREYYDKNGDFYDDFVKYRQEVENQTYTTLRIKNEDVGKVCFSYSNSEFFLKKNRSGNKKEALESNRDFLCRPERAIQKFIDYFCILGNYTERPDIREFSSENFFNSGILYSFHVNENPEEGFKNLYDLYKSQAIADVQFEFFRKCSERLYNNAVPS